uniref:Uncharacterized protein n=1 Tax=Arundo donax TaxID=35708 RepID=A0A0A9BI30_ARUDO
MLVCWIFIHVLQTTFCAFYQFKVRNRLMLFH